MSHFENPGEPVPDEAGWSARLKYNSETPLTVVIRSASGNPLALGGERAAESAEACQRAGVGCRVCVAGPDTKWSAGKRPSPLDGIDDLRDFPWNRSRRNGQYGKHCSFIEGIACELRSRGVLVYCKEGAQQRRSSTSYVCICALVVSISRRSSST